MDIKKFRKWNKEHKNFMTPNILKVKQKENYFLELSEGTGFNNNKIFGVSLIYWNGKQFKIGDEKSKMFYSKNGAIKYFDDLLDSLVIVS